MLNFGDDKCRICQIPAHQIITYPDRIILNVTQSKATLIIQRVVKANDTFKSRSPGWSQSIPLLCPQLERPPEKSAFKKKKTRWQCPQLYSSLSSHPFLSLATFIQLTKIIEGQGKVSQLREGRLVSGVQTDNRDRLVLKALQKVC